MSVNLQKGQKVDLTKGNAGLKSIMVGLGWDEAAKPQKGGLGGLFGGGKRKAIDCDSAAFLLDANGRIASNADVVYFGNLTHSSGKVKHMGDNLTGAGKGDDEQIFIDLAGLPPQYGKVVILVSIYQAAQRKQHFGMIGNAFIRLVNADTNQELCKYNLTESYPDMISMVFGEVYRHSGEWKFSAIGEGLKISSLQELTAKYGLN